MTALHDACPKVRIVPKQVPADGRWHQTDAEGKHAKNGNGRIKLFTDGTGGMVWNWQGEHKPEAFFYDSGVKLSQEEIDARNRRIEKERREAERELAESRAKAAEIALALWANGTAVQKHPYLDRKKVKPTDTIRALDVSAVSKITGYHPQAKGQKLTGNILIVPVCNEQGITSIEMIDETGKKAALSGGQKAGCYWMTGRPPENVNLLVIGEGVATVLSAAEAMQCTGVAALSCYNLKAVSGLMRSKYPQAKLIVLSDIGNGEQSAKEAAALHGCLLAKPKMPEGSTGTDFNDLQAEQGLDEVRRQIEAATQLVEEWPEPVLFGETETPEIAPALLPEPLAGYCKAVADSSQTSPGMAVMMGLSAVAACIQKRFEVCPFGDSYTEPVNLMTVTALESANRKSSVVSAMTEPLIAWEKQQMEALREQAGRVRHERDILIKSIESIKSAASKPNATDDDRRAGAMEARRLEESMPDEIVIPRLWIDDVTPERLQSLMADNGERIAVISAEGGIFEVIAGLYNGGKSNINVILQSHAGEPVRVERQGRSVMMQKPALTFGLSVQPSIISDLATGNKARFRGNGMLARLLYCLPKSTVGSRDVAKRRPVPDTIRTAYHSLIFRLLAIPPLSDEQGNERPRLITLAPDAKQAWLTFSQYVESKQGQYGEFHSIQDWTGKLPGAALRIAGLCHVVEYGEGNTVINRATMERALDLAELLIPHAKAAFALMGTDPAIPDAKYVLEWIRNNGADKFRRNEAHTAMHGKFQRVDRLITALKVLSERNIISDEQQRPTGRRPEIFYTVNPAILGRV